jgi:type II restriction/modification system DNA methylase subunit YeeA
LRREPKFAQFARRSLIEQVTSKLELVLAKDSAARRENMVAIGNLEVAIDLFGKEQTIDRVAYTWFNRFCALRFMDANRYTSMGVVSPAEGQFQPEILADAKMGHIEEEMVDARVRQQIFGLLDGKAPSRDPQGEAYRLLVVGACNYWHRSMPFLFERIDDYTELLMPDDLLSGNSILAYTREAMTPAACADVEVIGWLYQFYISEKKDEVFAGLKKNQKITPENIPAATQLFTPHWIVRYLVENSLGRLWMLNRPGSRLVDRMDYYIQPVAAETDFLRIGKPEEIKICDPACGSGHMLVYAFDLLYAIYEEEGYEPAEIPTKILTHNLYGVEIDNRAGAMAAFALTMQARARQRRFFRQPVQPHICVLANVRFGEGELKDYMDFVGLNLFTAPLLATLRQFEEADNFGALIRPEVTDVAGMLEILAGKNVVGELFLSETHQKVLRVLEQADYLSPKYHVVVANPPYMGGKGMNGRLGAWLKDSYPDSKSDLFAAFIEQGLELVIKHGFSAMVTMESWMFLSSFEKMRVKLLSKSTIQSMVHMPYLGKGGTSMGISFGTTAFVSKNMPNPKYIGRYCCIRYFETNDFGVPIDFPPQNERLSTASADDFRKIPGSPISYWVSTSICNAFSNHPRFEDFAPTRKGMVTARNEIYVREWHEVSLDKAGLDRFADRESAQESGRKWFSYLKGGGYRKWYGNKYDVVNWKNDGELLQTARHPSEDRVWATNFNLEYIFKPNLNWGAVTSSDFSARLSKGGEIFDAGGSACFPHNISTQTILGFLNAKICRAMLKALNPTLNFQAGNIANLPLLSSVDTTETKRIVENLIFTHVVDWDAFEISWDFTNLPLLQPDSCQPNLETTYYNLRSHWQETTLEMQRLEEENNHIFIEAYGLQDELTPEVPLNEITLTCNPHYRYGNDKTPAELEALLLADTIRELISYAVGCMFGRYALEKPGLILANQGQTLTDYLHQIPIPSFPADADNVIPILDGDWFSDDIVDRFRQFLRLTFGSEHYEANLQFIAQALGKNGKPRDLRDYFLKDFYPDHLKRYKKRPIYWLFSSPKGSFNALIYMHRYRPDTVSIILNDYLREFRTKLTAQKNQLEAVSISPNATPSEKTKALNEIEKLKKSISELEEYEREILYPLATQQISIDLDDGVKVNYLKFGAALKKIPGLEAKEE